jgi:hypothetical protein
MKRGASRCTVECGNDNEIHVLLRVGHELPAAVMGSKNSPGITEPTCAVRNPATVCAVVDGTRRSIDCDNADRHPPPHMKEKFAMSIKRILLALLVSGLLTVGLEHASAQEVMAPGLTVPRVPRVSQGAMVRQVVGVSEITITYHRPGVKGRTIWGGLLPYDAIWRAGANEPTLITFSDPATVDGKSLKAGTYRLVVTPKQGDWTIIFNSETKNWGTVYDSTYDVLRIPVKPATIPNQEWMMFSFTDLTPTSATVMLEWEKVRLAFKAEFNTLGNIEAAVGDWRLLNSAARFAMGQKGAEGKALEWVNRSIALEKNGSNVRTKAELLASQGKFAEAVTLGEDAISLTKAQNANANVSGLEKMVTEWKAKK